MIPSERGPATWRHCGGVHHFIGGRNCRFHLATFVAGGTILVSSVGDYYPFPDKRETLGAHPDSWYETMVFRSNPEVLSEGCPVTDDWEDLYSIRYSTLEDANEGHAALCKIYDTWEPAP